MNSTSVRREHFAVIQSLLAGTIPAVGLRSIQVGRTKELQAIIDDLERAREGVSTVRFVSGPLESGKTFLLNLARIAAIERGFLALGADISPSRRLAASGGEARAFYRQLMTNIAVGTCAETITIGRLLQDWIERLEQSVHRKGGGPEEVRAELVRAISPLHELTHGFDFATALVRYYEGHVAEDDAPQENALRWLRAEYTSQAEAVKDLGVRTIIDDDSVRNALNLFASFAKLAGYTGLLVVADELTTISRLVKETPVRNRNYEAIVQLLDDCLKSRIRGMVVLFGIEESCVHDRQRGLCSNEKLATWLAPNPFAMNGHKDFGSPVIMLDGLKVDDFDALLRNVRDVFAGPDESRTLMSDEDIPEYVRSCESRLGTAYFSTPRTVLKDFIGLLHILRQDPSASWPELLECAEAGRKAAENLAGVGTIVDPSLAAPWLDQAYSPKRRRRSPGRAAAMILAPILFVVFVIIGAVLIFAQRPADETELQVRYSEVRSGLRLPVDGKALPLRIGNFYSVSAILIEPRYVYVLTVDTNGHVRCVFGCEGKPKKVDYVQAPGADGLWPLVEPAGTRTVLLFGASTPISDPRRLKMRVESLRPLPQTLISEMLVLKNGKVERIRNTQIPADPNLPESDPGFLTTITEEFGDEFEIVQAVSFPLLAAVRHKGMTLYDFKSE